MTEDAGIDYSHERFSAEEPEVVLRSDAERDADRVLYSTAFRRMAGVTQVASTGEVALLHNRLTHSLKVGQVGRKIAASINYLAENDDKVRTSCMEFTGIPYDVGRTEAIDPWILESAGMVHDLGHPPFGHIAEKALQTVLSKSPNKGETLRAPEGCALDDSFEGNAQSFRIVTRLAFGRMSRSQGTEGLNLTRASLSAVLKYPWRRNDRPNGVDSLKEKWGAYDPETEILNWATADIGDAREMRRRPDGLGEWRSLTAQAMDWADDITYAVHDIEDFCRAGLIPVQVLRGADANGRLLEGLWDYCRPRLLENTLIRSKLDGDDTAAAAKVRAIFESVLSGLPNASQSTRAEREEFRQWSADRIDFYTLPSQGGLSIISETGFLDIGVEALLEVELLKKLTWYFVIDRPALGSSQRGQAKVIRELFVALWEWCADAYDGPQFLGPHAGRTNYTLKSLPPRLIDYLDVSWWQMPDAHGYKTDGERRSRAVCDFISSLTEKQCIELHSRLNGANGVSMLDAWFQV